MGNGATGSSGGAGGNGNTSGTNFAGGGGAASTTGANASGTTGGAGGTGATTQTGTNGNGSGGGGSSAGSSASGANGSSNNGGAGSGGAAHGVAGTGTDSDGGGNAVASGNGEAGGQPGAGGGGTGGAADTAGKGGDGKVIITYTNTATSTGNTVQDLTYTYDALGNITKIIDASNSSSSKTTYYSYDTLSRLLTATTTGASSGSNYNYTYTYDLLGNITSGPLGSYAYAGSSGANYANPDAATAVASKTLTYDNNGNLTAIGSTTYSWNYRNRLTQSGSGLATSTYGYDDTDSRVWLKEGNTKTIFPSALYNVVLGTTTATTTKHIMVGDMLVSTIENVGTTTTSSTTPVITKRFAVTDHLGSVTAMLTASGTVAEMLDVYPYGGMRIDTKSGSYVGEKNKYAQTQYDATANLNYAQARYQDAARGQFLSEDSIFLGDPSAQNLPDPQGLNSYSYANDNPITKSDPSGRSSFDDMGFFNSYYPNYPASVVQQIQQAKYDALKIGVGLPIATVMGGGVLAAAAIVPEMSAVAGAAYQGALVDVALRATNDIGTGQPSSGIQYGGSAIFGGFTGYLTSGTGVLGTIGVTALCSGVENKLLDGSPQPKQVAANSFGAGVGQLAGKAVSNVSRVRDGAAVVAQFPIGAWTGRRTAIAG